MKIEPIFKPYIRPKTENTKENIDNLISKIVEFLLEKTRFEGRAQNNNNRTHFDRVSFWFEEIDEVAHLKFTEHPSKWDINAIIDALNNEERWMMIQKGVGINNF